MKYKLLKNDCEIDDNFLENVLLNRGIKNPVEYIRAIKDIIENDDIGEYEYSYKKLNNIQKAVEMFVMHFKEKHPISILVDSDVDGMTSAASMYNYIEDLDKD